MSKTKKLFGQLRRVWKRWGREWKLPAINFTEDSSLAPRHFSLRITEEGAFVRAGDEVGFRDGMARAFGAARCGKLPASGRPEAAALKVRGLHLDLRCQVPVRQWFLALPDRLAQLGLNTLWIEWEGSFPFQKHLQIREADAFTPEIVRSFLNRCAELGIETVPVLQCFAHLEYLLHRPPYRHLEVPTARKYYTLDVASNWQPLFRDLIRELVEVHSSTYVHVGGDEIILDADTEEAGLKRYIAHLHKVAALIGEFGKRPILWADVLTRNPKLAQKVPRNLQLADWDYYTPVSECWPSPPAKRFPIFRKAAETFVLCPAVRGYPDNHRWMDWFTHKRNVLELARQAALHDADGVVVTSWAHTSDFNESSAHRVLGGISPRSRRMHFDAAWPLLAFGAAAMWNPAHPARGHILPEAMTPRSLEKIYERSQPIFKSKTPVVQPERRLTGAERRELIHNVPVGHDILNACILLADYLRGLGAAEPWTGKEAYAEFSAALERLEISFKRTLRGWLHEKEIEEEWSEAAGFHRDLQARLKPVFSGRKKPVEIPLTIPFIRKSRRRILRSEAAVKILKVP